jgi:glycosyltransferase involved in cell wall biosynthesis
VPQILLSRNALYTSSDFYTDLRSRGDYRLWLDTQIKSVFARLSIHAADEVVAPSQAFAEELRRWTGKPIMAIHHGFDRETFVHDPSPLPGSVQEKLDAACGSLRLLFVSHYNYYRNFETLIRAVSLVKRMLAPRTIRLFLTCKLAEGENPGAYGFNSAAVLIRELGLSKEIIQLGTVPYQLLHHLYQAAEVYVTPAYAESFGHPLIEAMSSGLPIVASDLDVHREICGPAAVYFSRFSSQELANWIVEVGESSELAAQLSRAGPKQADTFGWGRHLEEIVSVADRLLNRER